MKKFLLSLFSASALICNAQSQTPDHTPYKWIGDVNGDGYVNVADNTYLSNLILTNTFEEVGYVGKDVYTKDEVNVIVNQLISRIEALEAKHSETLSEETKTYTINGVEYPMPEAVDLGLPSGTKWANMNIGAKRLQESGFDFAWGDIIPHQTGYPHNYSFSWDNYCWMEEGYSEPSHITKYQYPNDYCGWWHEKDVFIGDNKCKLDNEDDAAYMLLGEKWNIPTIDNLEELLKYCIFSDYPHYDDYYFILTSKINGESIVIPQGRPIVGNCSGMWMSTLDYGENAYCCYYENDGSDIFIERDYRYIGMYIRAVTK